MKKFIASLLLTLALGTTPVLAQSTSVYGKVWEFSSYPGWGNGICVGSTEAACQWGYTAFSSSNDGSNLLFGMLGTTVTMFWSNGNSYIYNLFVYQ